MTSLKTPLHQNHIDAGAKMGAFAGYDMPLYYDEGVIAEHEWVRSKAGIFDVSHMGQILLKGDDVIRFLETLTPSSFSTLPDGRAKYTVMTNENGGIVDDLIITRMGSDLFFAVINAGCKEKDIKWIQSHLPNDIKMTRLDDRALIALQGPKAESVMNDLFGFDLSEMPYMWLFEMQIEGRDVYVSRLGYTGEDGFEISVPNDMASEVWEKLRGHSSVKPVGLAARDSLRLEMGYCLYGHDIDDNTTPVEADLGWVMGKDNAGFRGASKVLAHKNDGAPRKRIGVRLIDKGVAREGSEIYDASENGNKIGVLTSGGFSPSLKQAIAQGYVDCAFANAGEKIWVDVRGRKIAAELVTMPFMKARTKSMNRKAA